MMKKGNNEKTVDLLKNSITDGKKHSGITKISLLLLLLLIISTSCVKIYDSDPGNYYECIYSKNCQGDIERGFSCIDYKRTTKNCTRVEADKVINKINKLRFITERGARITFYNYPLFSRDSVNNKISDITCDANIRTESYLIGDELITCHYVGDSQYFNGVFINES